MLRSVAISILIPLFLTIIIELCTWKLVSLFSKEYSLKFIWLSIVALNLATNPFFNFFSNLLDSSRVHMFIEISFEVVIILIEAILLNIIYRKNFLRFLLLSGLMNLASYSIGLILFKPQWL